MKVEVARTKYFKIEVFSWLSHKLKNSWLGSSHDPSQNIMTLHELSNYTPL